MSMEEFIRGTYAIVQECEYADTAVQDREIQNTLIGGMSNERVKGQNPGEKSKHYLTGGIGHLQ